MKFQLIYLSLFFIVFLEACGSDDSVTCTTCTNDLTLDFNLCKEGNGRASVDGQDTGVDYNVYLANLQEEGTDCN